MIFNMRFITWFKSHAQLTVGYDITHAVSIHLSAPILGLLFYTTS